jgi:hypothetical protein
MWRHTVYLYASGIFPQHFIQIFHVLKTEKAIKIIEILKSENIHTGLNYFI